MSESYLPEIRTSYGVCASGVPADDLVSLSGTSSRSEETTGELHANVNQGNVIPQRKWTNGDRGLFGVALHEWYKQKNIR